MKRNTVLVVGILAAAGLEAVALLKGINGATLASAFTVIGSLVGFAFGKLESGSPPQARKFLALACAAGLALGGCAGSPFVVEACFVHPTYGKICASYVDGKVKISAAVALPPELGSKIEDYMKKLGGGETPENPF